MPVRSSIVALVIGALWALPACGENEDTAAFDAGPFCEEFEELDKATARFNQLPPPSRQPRDQAQHLLEGLTLFGTQLNEAAREAPPEFQQDLEDSAKAMIDAAVGLDPSSSTSIAALAARVTQAQIEFEEALENLSDPEAIGDFRKENCPEGGASGATGATGADSGGGDSAGSSGAGVARQTRIDRAREAKREADEELRQAAANYAAALGVPGYVAKPCIERAPQLGLAALKECLGAP